MVRKIELNHEVKGENTMEQLQVKCKGFEEGDWIPIRYTGRGEDLSPELELIGIAPGAKSIAITLDDASHPIFPNFNPLGNMEFARTIGYSGGNSSR